MLANKGVFKMEKNEYLKSKNIIKDFEKYEVLTINQLFNYAIGSFDNIGGFDFVEFFDYINIDVIDEFKEKGTAELLFNDFLEEDQGIYYVAQESFADLDKNLYVVKWNNNNNMEFM